MFCYQKNFSNPTLPVDEAQFYALVRAKQWNDLFSRRHSMRQSRRLGKLGNGGSRVLRD